MPDAVKVTIVERAGVELDYAEELDLTGSNIPFTASGFDSDNLDAAVQEAKADAIALPRFPLSSLHNGTLSNGQLVGVSNLVNNPIIVPVKSQLQEVTMYQNGGSSRDGEYLFYRNAQTGGNLFFTWTLANTTSAVADNGVDYTSPVFNAGDTLLVYFNDIGSNHNDVSLVYFFQSVE